jgi:surface antigen/LysM repeat protein
VKHIARSYQIVGTQITRTGRKVRRSFKKRLIRYGLVTLNFTILAAVAFLIFKHPSSSTGVKRSFNSQAETSSVANPLDELSSADIAVQVASLTRLPEAPSVKNNADSQNEQLKVVPSGDQTVTMPQIVSTALKSKKDIKTYVTKPGDTVGALVGVFGVTSESIKGSNGLTSDALPVGKTLYIPPVTGLVYQVKAGDTVDSLANKYRANKEQIIADNDTDVSGLKVGERILIRDGKIPAPVTTYVTNYAWGLSAVYGAGGNGYDFGWCTWYASKRRSEVGRPVPSNLGNAYSWYRIARAQGLPTGLAPSPGAVAVNEGGNHVMVVETVNGDGSFWVSEMNSHGQVSMTNATPTGGWGVRDYKFFPSAGNLKFIY